MIYPLGAANAANGAGDPKATGATQFDELFDGVDDLIKRVADVENPEIRRTRAKVHAALVIAKKALKNTAHHVLAEPTPARNEPAPLRIDSLPLRSQPAPLAGRSRIAALRDDDVLDPPERSLGVALLVALGLSLIVSLGQ
jgi:hypothetical protein